MSETLPRAFGVFGDPIAHSRSPAMHGAAFATLGLPHRYLPFHVVPGQLEAAIRGVAALGFGGVNLTVPHKRAALGICDQLAPEAARIGAVNTLRFDPELGIVGHNTDGVGFLAGLAQLPGPPLEQLRRAVVLGSGGASLAIVDALLAHAPQLELRWVSRRPEGLAERFPSFADRIQPTSWAALELDAQLLVNTTIVGLAEGPADFPAPLKLDALEADARVVDIVYPAPKHGLLAQARARGLPGQDGLPMLLWQGVRALELWLQRELPTTAVAAMGRAIGIQG